MDLEDIPDPEVADTQPYRLQMSMNIEEFPSGPSGFGSYMGTYGSSPPPYGPPSPPAPPTPPSPPFRSPGSSFWSPRSTSLRFDEVYIAVLQISRL